MPSRAYTSFLLDLNRRESTSSHTSCQCPLGLIPHFYDTMVSTTDTKGVSMPSRAYTSFLRGCGESNRHSYQRVSMPSRAYTSFLLGIRVKYPVMYYNGVNALSGLYLISTSWRIMSLTLSSNSVNALSGLYLISTMKQAISREHMENWCQCPLGLIPHFYGTPSKT